MRRHFKKDLHVWDTRWFGVLLLRQCSIGGQTEISRTGLRSLPDRIAIACSSATIGGTVFINKRTAIIGTVELTAEISGQVELSNATIRVSDDNFAIAMESNTVGGGVMISDQSEITGVVYLRATIRGDVKISNATFDAGEGKTAIDMHSATVGNAFHICDGTTVTGQVAFPAKIGGQVAISNSTISVADGRTAIAMESATIGGSVNINMRTSIRGSIDLRARIEGHVAISNATVIATKALPAINLDGAIVGGTVHICDESTITGRVDLRARVGQHVVISSSTINSGEGEKAIDMNASTVNGTVSLKGGTTITGRVDLGGVIARQVAIWNITINAGAEHPALTMNSASVCNAVSISHGSKITGLVDICAKIGGSVIISDITVNAGAGRAALRMNSASVGGSVLFRDGTVLIGDVDLTFIKVGVAIDASVPRTLHRTEVDRPGCYEQLSLTVLGNLSLDYAEVQGPMSFLGTCLAGQVGVRHAKIQGDLHFCGGVLGRRSSAELCSLSAFLSTAAGTNDLLANATDVSIAPRNPASIDSNVSASGYEISEQADTCDEQSPFSVETQPLVCERRILSNWNDGIHDAREPLRPFSRPVESTPYQCDLDLRLAKIGGQLWLRGQRVLGDVDLEDACIQGEANFTHTRVHGDLRLCGAKVLGRLFGDANTEAGALPQVAGTVDVRGATLSELNLRVQNTPGELQPIAIWLDEVQAGRVAISWRFQDGGPLLSVHRMRFEELVLSAPLAGPESRSALIEPPAVQLMTASRECVLLWRKAKRRLRLFQGRVKLFQQTALSDDWEKLSNSARGWWSAVSEFGAKWLATCRAGVARCHQASSSKSWRLDDLLSHNHKLHHRFVNRYELTGRDALRAVLWVLLWTVGMFAILSGAETSGAMWAAFAGMLYLMFAMLTALGSWRPKPDAIERLKGMLKHAEFSPAFYVAVEQFYRSHGDDPTADNVFLSRRRRELESVPGGDRPRDPCDRGIKAAANRDDLWGASFGLAERFYRWTILDFMLGYGVRSARVVHLFLLLFLLSWGVFMHRDSVERPLTYQALTIPSVTRILGGDLNVTHGSENPYLSESIGPSDEEWSTGQAFFMALRLSVPVIDLAAESDWAPSSSYIRIGGHPVIEYENYAAVIQVANLILIPLGIAGLTGFLKRRQS